MKLSEIAEAAGCSKAYASDIRRGKWTPHVSTWPALEELVGVKILQATNSWVDSSLQTSILGARQQLQREWAGGPLWPEGKGCPKGTGPA